MNGSLTLCLEVIFWFALFVVFYTYLGYGIVLYILVKLKELFVKPVKYSLPASNDELPEVTLFITAFNEEDVVDEKMENSLDLDYPACVIRHYRAFWEKGIEADIVDMDADLFHK